MHDFWGAGMGVEAYVNYFGVLAGVASAILGLALVTFTLQVKLWRELPLRQAVAVTTLAELSAPVFFGLIFLTARHPWHLAGYVVGALGYAVMAMHVVVYIRHHHSATSFDNMQMFGLLITATTYSLIAWFPSLELRAYVCIWFVFSGLFETWLFLRPDSDKTAAPSPSPTPVEEHSVKPEEVSSSLVHA
jgi:hypothetical protein